MVLGREASRRRSEAMAAKAPALRQAAPYVGETVSVPARDLAQGQRVTVALRPERFGLAAPGSPNTVPGEVEEVMFLGAVTRLRVRTNLGPVTVELHGEVDAELKLGMQVALAFDGAAATVFAADDG